MAMRKPARKTTKTPRRIPITKEVVEYIARYGGLCRDCADQTSDVCDRSGLPCGRADKAIRHVLSAYNYGVEHGFLS